MRKRIFKTAIKIVIGLFILGIIGFFGIYFIQNKYEIKKLNNLFLGADIEKGDLTKIQSVRCNWNIFKPEYAVVHDLFNNITREYNIYFFNQKNIFSFEIERIGTTTVKNTTFEELLKMVKEDCYQFQKSKGTPKDKTINWGYLKYDKRYEVTEEERQKEMEEAKKEEERLRNLPPEEAEKNVREYLKEQGFNKEQIDEIIEYGRDGSPIDPDEWKEKFGIKDEFGF